MYLHLTLLISQEEDNDISVPSTPWRQKHFTVCFIVCSVL